MRFSFTFLFILLSFYSFSQGKLLSVEELEEQETYKSLEEASTSPEEVYILDLHDKKLKQFPQEILGFKNLQILYLSENKIQSLPENINELEKLQILDLYDNKIVNLPNSFSELKNLKRLDLGYNGLKGVPEQVYDLLTLEKLFLYGNKIKNIPEEITEMNTLREFRLGNNRIKKLPENMGSLQNLEELHIAHNQLYKLPNSFSKLQKLQWLDLSFNYFKSIPQNIPQSNSLENIYLWDRRSESSNKSNFGNSATNWHFLKPYEGNLWALTLGAAYGNQGAGLELGLARAYRKDFVMIATGISGEYYFNGVVGAKASVWFNSLLSLGLHALYYTDGSENAFGFRPEVGIGTSYFSLMYGYNIIGGGSNSEWSRSLITLRVLLPIKPFHLPWQ